MDIRTHMKCVQIVGLISIVFALLLKTVKSEECYHHVRTSEVTSPNYPNNYPNFYKCAWKFETIPGCKIKLAFYDLELEANEGCVYDYVALYDGETTSDPLLGKFCSKDEWFHITSTSNKMLMVLSTDESTTKKGFKASYSTECAYILPTTTSVQDFTINQLPVDGPSNIYTFTFMFETTVDYTIKTEFDSFQFPEELFHLDYIDCDDSNSVTFYDGLTVDDPLLGDFCSEMPSTFSSTTHRMLMILRFKGTFTDASFRMKYWAEFNLKSISGDAGRYFIDRFLITRNDARTINKWGPGIARTAVALFLYDPQFFAPGNDTGEEIAYELTLQLKSKLVLKKQISTTDLALFVNAMTVACIDPKNFFGVNIVAELSKRLYDSDYANPFHILTLCNAGERMGREHALVLENLFEENLTRSWTDTQAMIVMALKCISKKFNMKLSTSLNEKISQLKSKQETNGTIDNLKSTALAIQALIATDSYETDFNLSMALNSIFKDIKSKDVSFEEMYYILPILKWKTLLNINSDHCLEIIKTDLEDPKRIRKYIDDRIPVEFSIVIGDEMDFLRTWKVLVPSNYTLYQLLENITSSELNCKMRYVYSGGKPYVFALDGFEDSTEEGRFWYTYANTSSPGESPTLLEKSPVDIRVNENNKLFLWYKSLSTSSPQKLSTKMTHSAFDVFSTTEETASTA